MKACMRSLVIAMMFTLIGCATTSAPIEKEPAPQAVYSFSYEPPEKAEKCGVTIGIVSPQWDKSIGYGEAQTPWFDAIISPNPNKLLLYPKLMAQPYPPPRDIIEILDNFHRSVQDGFESVLIARGFDVMGPFENIDEMTYPQKQACHLIIVPEFSQIVRSNPSTAKVHVDRVEGTATSRTAVVLNIYEPLSREKLWIKKFTHTSDPFPFRMDFAYEYVYQEYERIGVQRKGVTWDNRAANLAVAEEDLFEELMQKTWDYVNREEMMVLKAHSDELRKRKRF